MKYTDTLEMSPYQYRAPLFFFFPQLQIIPLSGCITVDSPVPKFLELTTLQVQG